MKFAPLAGFLLFAGAVVTAQQLTIERPGDAANQIRLDRPVGGGGGGGGGTPAPSAPAGVINDISVDDTMRVLKGLKFSSMEIEQTKSGARFIRASIGDQPTIIWHNNCENDRCRALHFAAYLGKQDSVNDAFIHDYNRNTMFTKMAKDSDGELQVTMGVSLSSGVTEAHIRAMGDSWITYFGQALEYKPEGK